MHLLDDLDACCRTIIADNFFTSISLGHCEVVQKKLRRSEVYGLQNKDGVKLIKWKDEKDVLMISTRPSHSAVVVNTGNINSKNESIMNPQVVLDYNEGRQGTDLSGQLSTYFTCLRRSIKWY